MKKLKYLFLLPFIAGIFTSCEEEEQVDILIDNVERGAILRTVQILSNEFPFDAPDTAEFSVELEEQDQEDGALLSDVQVFVTFSDGSSEEGDSSGGIVDQEVMVTTIPGSAFAIGPNGLPRFTYTVSLTELLGLVNLTADNIFGGDTFTTRFNLRLTDGREFTNDLGDNIDVNGNIASGSFFQSPFRYTTPVVCPIGEEEFIGDYTLMNTVAVDFGNLFTEGQTVTLEAGDTSVQRFFSAIVFEDLDPTFPVLDFTFDLVCNEVIPTSNQDTGLGCGGGTLFIGSPIGDVMPGTYVTGDDSTFTIVVGYNEGGAATCAVESNAILTLSRQ